MEWNRNRYLACTELGAMTVLMLRTVIAGSAWRWSSANEGVYQLLRRLHVLPVVRGVCQTAWDSACFVQHPSLGRVANGSANITDSLLKEKHEPLLVGYATRCPLVSLYALRLLPRQVHKVAVQKSYYLLVGTSSIYDFSYGWSWLKATKGHASNRRSIQFYGGVFYCLGAV